MQSGYIQLKIVREFADSVTFIVIIHVLPFFGVFESISWQDMMFTIAPRRQKIVCPSQSTHMPTNLVAALKAALNRPIQLLQFCIYNTVRTCIYTYSRIHGDSSTACRSSVSLTILHDPVLSPHHRLQRLEWASGNLQWTRQCVLFRWIAVV